MRAFIAAELPASLQDNIGKATAGLRKTLGLELVHWVPPSNVHLTLKFLGDVPPSNLGMIEEMLTAEAAKIQAFDVCIDDSGTYPSTRRPQVLWVGLNAPRTLGLLQNALERGAAQLGYTKEERKFSPHLTIGRVRKYASGADLRRIQDALADTKISNLGSFKVNALHIYKSELQSAGAVYTKLFSAKLAMA